MNSCDIDRETKEKFKNLSLFLPVLALFFLSEKATFYSFFMDYNYKNV